MKNKLYIVGIGPGDKEFIYPGAMKIIEESDVLIGGRRNLDLFHELRKEEVVIGSRLAEVEQYILGHIGRKVMVVLASGDPGLFSISEYLKNKLSGIEMMVYPGISSLQYMCAILQKSWDDVYIASIHGKKPENIAEKLADMMKRHKKVMLFTGGASTPAYVCRELAAGGLKDVSVVVGERLSYPDERIVSGSPEELGKIEFDSLSIMLVESLGSNPAACIESEARQGHDGKMAWGMATPGIPDELFIRGDVPMTKEEIRAVALSKLRLREDSVVCDIGAGTGSVSIECGLIAKKGRVYAIEKDPDALELIRANVEKFDAGNVTVVSGAAPDILSEIPMPDRIFVGGTGGRMDGILDWAAKAEHSVRVVVNAVAVESVYEALEGLSARGFTNIDIASVSISKGRLVGKKHLMQALNPIYIISGEK